MNEILGLSLAEATMIFGIASVLILTGLGFELLKEFSIRGVWNLYFGDPKKFENRLLLWVFRGLFLALTIYMIAINILFMEITG